MPSIKDISMILLYTGMIAWILSNSSETLYLRDPAPLSLSCSINTICKIHEIYHVYIHTRLGAYDRDRLHVYDRRRTYVRMRMHIIHRVTFRTVAGPYLTNRNDSYQCRCVASHHMRVYLCMYLHTHVVEYLRINVFSTFLSPRCDTRSLLLPEIALLFRIVSFASD